MVMPARDGAVASEQVFSIIPLKWGEPLGQPTHWKAPGCNYCNQIAMKLCVIFLKNCRIIKKVKVGFEQPISKERG